MGDFFNEHPNFGLVLDLGVFPITNFSMGCYNGYLESKGLERSLFSEPLLYASPVLTSLTTAYKEKYRVLRREDDKFSGERGAKVTFNLSMGLLIPVNVTCSAVGYGVGYVVGKLNE